MRRTQAPAPGFYDGYAAVAEVALHLLLAATSLEERAAAALRMREALYQLARFGLAFPMGRARLFNIAGRLLWHRGERRLALALLAQAQRSARAIGKLPSKWRNTMCGRRWGGDGGGDSTTR